MGRVKQEAARTGRPSSERACEIEPRILDAAARVFLERGFSAASIKQIAETARAGKPTIYARYPDKDCTDLATEAGRQVSRAGSGSSL